jgi:hypothetical protein
MLFRCFVGAGLVSLCVGILAAIGAGSSNDPFAAMGRFGAYLMIAAAIAGGLLLALALSAGADRVRDRDRGPPPRS